MPFSNGQELELLVRDRAYDSAGYPYILLENPYPADHPNLEVRVYNTLLCQEEDLPDKMYVKVKIDAFGKITFKQDVERVLREHYEADKFYIFSVKSIERDVNTKAPYYELADEIYNHRCYFRGEQKHNVGDDIILKVKGFTNSGFLDLEEVERRGLEQIKTETAIPKEEERVNIDQTSPFANTEENGEVEFKTSIVYVPGSDKADVDKQIKTILRALAAFMNTEKGGTLYIGVHDKTKEVVGIEKDFENLNSSESDEFNYNASRDHYELKIRNSVVRLCSTYADSLLNFKFEEVNEKTYCQIDVKPADKPVYVNGNCLFVRHGNHINQLKGEEMSYYIVKKLAGNISRENSTINAEEILKLVSGYLSRITPGIPEGVELPPLRDPKEIDRWIIFYTKGYYLLQRTQSNEANVLFQVPIYKRRNDPRLIMCYDDGRINTVKYSDLKGRNLSGSRTYKYNYRFHNDGLMRLFIAEPTDYIVGKSVDSNGTVYVKLHSVSEYNTTQALHNQGRQFLPENHTMTAVGIIGPEHQQNVEHLIVARHERARTAGIPINNQSPLLRKEIAYIEALLKRMQE